MKRIVCIMLALCICTATVFAGNILPEQNHKELAYGTYTEYLYDHDAFIARAERITGLCEREENLDTVKEELSCLREEFLILTDKLEISSIASYQDVTDTFASDDYMAYLEYYYDADEILAELIPTLLDSPCAGAVDQEDWVFSSYLWAYGGYGEPELELYYEEERLIDEYYAALDTDFSVEFGGRSYTQSEANAAYNSYSLSDEEYDEICLLIAQAQNDALAGMYLKLVENRKAQMAQHYRSDVPDYYDGSYGRDLSSRDRKELYAAVKAYIVPLLSKLYNRSNVLYNQARYQEMVWDEQELLDITRQALEQVSPELTVAMDEMMEFGYYDIAYGENKVEGAFTSMLYYPNRPFLLMQPTFMSYDFTTLVHEYGHYNAFFCAQDTMAYNLDLAEVHSQGLELLMLRQYDSVFGEQAELEELYTIYDILTALVDGCMFDELERFAYSQENLTVEDMNRKYMELLKEYGYRDPEDPEELGYGWVMTGHLYGYPMYYLSYATSATAALDIWEMSLSDYEGAVDTYLRLVALGESGTFFDTLEEVGLGNSLSRDSVHSLSSAVCGHFGFSEIEETAVISPTAEKTIYIVSAILAAWAILAVTVMIIVLKKEKKKREQLREFVYNSAAGSACEGAADLRCGGDPAPSECGEAGGCEGGTADALPAAGDQAVPEPLADEAAGPEC